MEVVHRGGVIRRLREELPVGWQVTALGLVLAVTAVLAPALVLTFGLFLWARRQGWPSSRMRNVTVFLLVTWLFAFTMQVWQAGWDESLHVLTEAFRLLLAGQIDWANTVGVLALVEVPIAAVAAWVLLRRQEVTMMQSTQPRRALRWRQRTHKNQRNAALRRARQEITPMSRLSGLVVLAQQYREEKPREQLTMEYLRARHPVYLGVTDEELNRHITLTGQTGAGKTELLKRLTAGWTEARWRMYGTKSSQDLAGSLDVRTSGGHASPRPLTIFVDAKGGEQSADVAYEWADTMEAIGLAPERVGVFPFLDGLNMWSLPPEQLVETIHELAKTEHRFYDTLQRGLLRLVLEAPGVRPPANSVEFLRRINPRELQDAWAGHPGRLAQLDQMVQSGTLATDLILLDDLFGTLGHDFDAQRSIQDFDALFVSLPGTEKNRVAAAKARLLVELLKFELTHGARREVLFVFDEWSAVSELVDVLQLLQTARSLGGRVVLSAQSYATLGRSEQEVNRILSVMGGGHLVMAGNQVEEWAKLAGTRFRAEVGAHLEGESHVGEGTLRMQSQFTVSPDELRQLPERDVVRIKSGVVQFGTVVKLDATRRLPSKAIHRHPWRQIPTAGPASEGWALHAERKALVQRMVPQLTAGDSSKVEG